MYTRKIYYLWILLNKDYILDISGLYTARQTVSRLCFWFNLHLFKFFSSDWLWFTALFGWYYWMASIMRSFCRSLSYNSWGIGVNHRLSSEGQLGVHLRHNIGWVELRPGSLLVTFIGWVDVDWCYSFMGTQFICRVWFCWWSCSIVRSSAAGCLRSLLTAAVWLVACGTHSCSTPLGPV